MGKTYKWCHMSGDLRSMLSVVEHCVEAKCCEKKDYDKALIPRLDASEI